MKTRTLKELLLYNYRYRFGYLVILGFIIYFLSWQLGSLPGGISQAEITVAGRHTSLTEILNLPLYPLHSILQFLVITVFGVNALILRVPGVIIGLVVAFLLYHLLRKWFGKPTALLSTAIFISADWFLFITRLATGGIEFSLWFCLALLCFTKLIERKTKWLLLYTVALIGLLFCPFGVYAAATLGISLFACRVFRERAKEAELWVKVPSMILLFIALAAIIWTSLQNVAFAKNLLGIQTLPSLSSYFENLLSNLSSVVAILPNANPLINPTGVFFVRFFELIFILFGVIMFWRTRINRLNLTLLILSVVLALASGLSSGSRGSGLLLVPAGIFMTAGIRHFIYRWQKTFPHNPYARVMAYLPMAVLFISVVALHYTVYFQLWPTQNSTRQTFSKDFSLIKQELQRKQYVGKTCFIESSDTAFNQLLSATSPACSLQFKNGLVSKTLPQVLIVKPESNLRAGTDTSRVLVSDISTGSARWVIIDNKL